MTTKWANPDKNPATRSVLAVCYWCSSRCSSLWFENFADFSIFLKLSLQPQKQSGINVHRALKGSWTKPFDVALNISLCLNEFCLAVQRAKDLCWFLQLLAWLAPNQPNDGMLVTHLGAELVLFCHLMAELEQNNAPAFSSAGYCGCIPQYPTGRINVNAGDPATGCILIENEGNIPSLFTYPGWPGSPHLSGMACSLCLGCLCFPHSHIALGASGAGNKVLVLTFLQFPPSVSLVLCLSISMFKNGNCISCSLVQTQTHSLGSSLEIPLI